MEKDFKTGLANDTTQETAVETVADESIEQTAVESAAAEKPESMYKKNRFGICIPDEYELDSLALYVYKLNGRKLMPKPVCGPIAVKGIGVFNWNDDRSDPGILTSFVSTNLKKQVSLVLKLSDIMGNVPVCKTELGEMGFAVKTKCLPDLMDYLIDTYSIDENRQNLSLFVSQPGWGDDFSWYALPDKVYGGNGRVVPVIPNVNGEYRQRGTLAEWKQHVAEYAKGNPILQFALAAAFAAVLMRPLGISTGFIFHLAGDSSSGKTAAQRLGQGVWHRGSSYKPWSTSANGSEAALTFFNDNLLVMDELGRFVDEFKGDIGKKIYEMSNGKGKMRMTASLQLQKSNEWYTTILSSGEHSLEYEMKLRGKKATAGEKVRMPTIPVTVDMIYDLHGQVDSKALAEMLEKQTELYYGTAGPAFLGWLIADDCKVFKELAGSDLLKECHDELLQSYPNAGSQVRRQTDGFAAALLAGRLAKKCGILDFDLDYGVKFAYQQFIDGLGGVENDEQKDILDTIECHIQQKQFGDFMPLEMDSDGHKWVPSHKFIPNCCGYVDEQEQIFYYYNTCLTKELLPGRSIQRIRQVLADAGWLVAPEKKKYSFRVNNQKQLTLVKLRYPQDDASQGDGQQQETVDPVTGVVTAKAS